MSDKNQMSVNVQFLMDKIDAIYDELCPEKIGTWQQRAEQAVDAARKMKRHLIETRASLSRIATEASSVLQDNNVKESTNAKH